MVVRLIFLLLAVCVVCLLVVLTKEIRRVRRRAAVGRELRQVEVQSLTRPGPFPRERRSDMARTGVPSLRAKEPRDPGAARVLAFHDELARRGYYVHEMSLQRRLN